MTQKALDAVKKAVDDLRNNKYAIMLDCPPDSPKRPNELIEEVIRGTGLPIQVPVMKFFGSFMWDYKEVENIETIWPQIQSLLKYKIEKLYRQGVIRFGSWGRQ